MPKQVQTGTEFEYTIRVTNLTNGALTDVVVTDTLNENIQHKSSNPPANVQGNKLIWAFSGLGPKQAVEINGVAVAIVSGILKNCADVTYRMPVCVQSVSVQPNIIITKTAPAEVSICDPIKAVFKVENTGTGPANNVRIIDNLPEGLVTAQGSSKIEYQVITPYDDECFEDFVNVDFDIDNTVLTFYSHTDRNLETRIRKTIRDFIKDPHPYITMQDGQALTFKEFKERNWEMTGNQYHHGLEPDEKKFMKQDIREFRDWYQGDYPVTFNPRLLSDAEEKSLLGRQKESQYSRARRDQTLRQLWPSRRIALNYILPRRELGDPELIYAQGIRNVQWQIQLNTKRITRLFEIDSPRVILQMEIDLLEEKKYVLWALRTHKKWVKEALGELLSEQ